MINLQKEKALLLVIDIQERLASSMPKDEFGVMLERTKILIRGCSLLGIPIIQSLQYKKGLGESVEGLFGDDIKKYDFEKRAFSCCYENSELMQYLQKNRHIRQVIIAGMESHICVLQSARDLIQHRYDVVVACDCVISRNVANKQNALEFVACNGGFSLNSESILFDLLKTSSASEFKAISNLIK